MLKNCKNFELWIIFSEVCSPLRRRQRQRRRRQRRDDDDDDDDTDDADKNNVDNIVKTSTRRQKPMLTPCFKPPKIKECFNWPQLTKLRGYDLELATRGARFESFLLPMKKKSNVRSFSTKTKFFFFPFVRDQQKTGFELKNKFSPSSWPQKSCPVGD